MRFDGAEIPVLLKSSAVADAVEEADMVDVDQECSIPRHASSG